MFARSSQPKALCGLALAVSAIITPQDAQSQSHEAERREHIAAMAAHHLCSGTWVVGRDNPRSPEQILQQDIARFPAFAWQDDFAYEVDTTQMIASVWGPGVPRRTGKYNGDQGCTILPRRSEEHTSELQSH